MSNVQNTSTLTATCHECGAALELPAELKAGEIIDCTNCGEELEVISTSPLILEAYEEEEK